MTRLIAAAFLASTLIAAGAASAMPLTQMTPAQNSNVITVAGGCGPGMHRGPRGGCLQNFEHPADHACPRGFHIGPGGRCRGNGR